MRARALLVARCYVTDVVQKAGKPGIKGRAGDHMVILVVVCREEIYVYVYSFMKAVPDFTIIFL